MKVNKWLLSIVLFFPLSSLAFEQISWEQDLNTQQQKMLSPYKDSWQDFDKKKQSDLVYKANLLIDLKVYAEKSKQDFEERWQQLSKADQSFVLKLMRDNKRRREDRSINFNQYGHGFQGIPSSTPAQTPENVPTSKR